MPPNIPNEVWGHIFSFLLTARQKHRLRYNDISDILEVRLVCRRWNDLATKQLFRTITLRQTDTTIENEFGSWQRLLDTKSIRTAVRRVAIETIPDDDDYGCALSAWPKSWIRDGEWPEFVSAINRIQDLPNLVSLEVRFDLLCAGRQHMDDHDSHPREPATTRQRTLEVISRAMRERESRPDSSVIRELVLEFVQNVPLPREITDNLLQNIQRLHLLTTQDEFIDYKSYAPELREFPSYLQQTLLPSVAEQLVELTLSGFNWGAIPGEFNGRGLSFPRLEKLTLYNYVILRHDQFDWVLEQKSLTCLHLSSCAIATHCLVLQPEYQRWGIDLRGWRKASDLDPHMYIERPEDYSLSHIPQFGQLEPGWYLSDLRWNTMFDSIREQLLGLQDFKFDMLHRAALFWSSDSSPSRPSNCYMAFNHFWGSMESMRSWNQWLYTDESLLGNPLDLYRLAQPADS